MKYLELATLNFINVSSSLVIAPATAVERISDRVRGAATDGVQECARSGGHSHVANSRCDGVLLDIGAMPDVTVDGAGVASVQAGFNLCGTL